MRKFVIAGLMVAAAVPVMAQVAPIARPMPPRPMADGVLTRAEVQAQVTTMFAKRDANHDGFITKDEMAMGREMAMHRMGGPEGGPRGAPGMERRMGDPSAMFDRLDANRDGTISRDEFAKGHEMRVEKRVVIKNGQPVAPGAPGAPGMKMRMHRMGGMGGMGGLRMMVMADANKDGRISLQEATTSSLQHFDMADTNRDGRLTADEMRAAHQKMAPMDMRKAG